MKKILAGLLIAAMALLAVSCGSEPAPVVTTEAPTSTAAPTTTKAPETTKAPTTTAAPTTTKAPETTKTPETTKAPTTTAAPTTTKAPATTAAPTTTKAPTTTAAPVTTAAPDTTSAANKKTPGTAKVYLDGTGTKAGSFATLPEAYDALPEDGGTIIVSGDTATPSDVSITLGEKPLNFTSENGAKLILGRCLLLNSDVSFTDITIVNNGPNGIDFIYMFGHSISVSNTVVTEPSAKTGRYTSIFAGGATNADVVAENSEILISGGTWRNVYLGNYSGFFDGNVSAVLENCKITGGSFFFSNANGGLSSANCTVTMKSGDVSAFKIISNSSAFAGETKLTVEGGTVHATNLPEDYECDFTVDLSKGGTVTLDPSITGYKTVEGNGKIVAG